MLFRELKTRYALDEFDMTKKHVVEILVYAALLTLLVGRELLDLVSEHAADEAVFPSERWAATFRSHAQLILHELSRYLGYTPPPLIDRMAEDGQKVYQERLILQERLATATQQEIVNQLKTNGLDFFRTRTSHYHVLDGTVQITVSCSPCLNLRPHSVAAFPSSQYDFYTTTN